MRAARHTFLVLVSLALVSACTSPSAPERQSQMAPDADLASYQTFGWKAVDQPTADEPLRLLDVNIRNAISSELTQRGYTEVTENPQLIVTYETSSQDKVKSNPFRIGIGIGSFGSNVGGSVNVGSPSVQSYQEGNLVIHVLDAAANRELWLGSVSSKVSQSKLDAAAVSKAVSQAMKDFPSRETAP
ncbi:MAG: DUF4136 domain-containing protein [Gammaproteobacteria bacterium]